MAEKPTEGGDAKPKKSKKMLIIIIAALVVVLAGGGAAFFLLKKQHASDEEGADTPAASHSKKPEAPPQYLPLENLVVNLADPGGNRFAQVGISLQVVDAHTADTIKGYMPAIRNALLILVSRRTSDELLIPEGKEKLANDILDTVRELTGMPAVKGSSPVQAVLFSSFIVQ